MAAVSVLEDKPDVALSPHQVSHAPTQVQGQHVAQTVWVPSPPPPGNMWRPYWGPILFICIENIPLKILFKV